ncbi:hypothetical protein [Brucella grignonensis]|uniref:hypothetical protein n=1 Tax=Brucella grignonensis TaxID=94627 RepID=UPI001ABF17FE|nr:hypothetical protein [Brucella grignonensis]
MACYDCFFVQSMPRASKQQARYAVGRCLMLWSSNDVTQQGSRPKTKLAGFRVLTVLVRCIVPALLAFSFHSAAPKGKVRQFVGLLQTVVAVALFFVASLKQFYRFRLARRIAAGRFSFN